MSIINIDLEKYNDLEYNDKPLILDFWAQWCGPCKMFSPIFEKVAEKNNNEFIFGKVDADTQEDLCRKFNIKGIPTTVILKKGVIVGTKVGLMNQKQFEDFIHNI